MPMQFFATKERWARYQALYFHVSVVCVCPPAAAVWCSVLDSAPFLTDTAPLGLVPRTKLLKPYELVHPGYPEGRLLLSFGPSSPPMHGWL